MRAWRRWFICSVPLLGLTLANGCLMRAENNLDLLLSPGSVDNALVLPYSAVAGLAEFLVKYLHR